MTLLLSTKCLDQTLEKKVGYFGARTHVLLVMKLRATKIGEVTDSNEKSTHDLKIISLLSCLLAFYSICTCRLFCVYSEL